MKISASLSQLSLATVFAITPAIALSNPVFAETASPLAILVSDNASQMTTIESALKDLDAEVWQVSPSDFIGGHNLPLSIQRRSPNSVSVIDAKYTFNSIPEGRPIFLIGQGVGVQSIAKLVPLIERPIELVAFVEPPKNQAISYSAVVGPQVGMFLNYFQLPNENKNASLGDLPCDPNFGCYQFENQGDRLDTNDWIQEDIIANFDAALNQPKIPRAIAVVPEVRPLQTVLSGLQTPSNQPCQDDILLRAGGADLIIKPGTEWKTCGGYRLTFQIDGNFVLYNSTGRPIWSSNTWTPRDPSDLLTIKPNGNIIISRRGQPLWSTQTGGNPEAVFAFHKTGEVALYTKDFQPLWSTNTQGQ
ncbi:Curculin domain protein (mannose-binding) lectin [[Leptolyngbya] sp. PCC 7376]|uniref:hypothetical protein n=1 Tax=[Leptolyngbya] sp. PCC 7376 TaxID=111781 RepID=UPI00029F485C|nr:hypothetical protein [[Leptolyngbya] sp. PCC 7376]AFY36818.1 Curculin domain protein (mannose-binding) lectin [[Leptolyngbya] sp. PCC 7376]